MPSKSEQINRRIKRFADAGKAEQINSPGTIQHPPASRSGLGFATSMRMAILTEGASSQSETILGRDTPYIKANLCDADGAEITSGADSNVKLYALVSGGTKKLDAAAPRLKNNDPVLVAKMYGVWWLLDIIIPAKECSS